MNKHYGNIIIIDEKNFLKKKMKKIEQVVQREGDLSLMAEVFFSTQIIPVLL